MDGRTGRHIGPIASRFNDSSTWKRSKEEISSSSEKERKRNETVLDEAISTTGGTWMKLKLMDVQKTIQGPTYGRCY